MIDDDDLSSLSKPQRLPHSISSPSNIIPSQSPSVSTSLRPSQSPSASRIRYLQRAPANRLAGPHPHPRVHLPQRVPTASPSSSPSVSPSRSPNQSPSLKHHPQPIAQCIYIFKTKQIAKCISELLTITPSTVISLAVIGVSLLGCILLGVMGSVHTNQGPVLVKKAEPRHFTHRYQGHP